MLEPIEIHLAGRAVCEFAGVRIPVEQIAVERNREWIREHLSRLDPRAHVRVVSHVRPVSADLASLFRGGQRARTPFANDTSFGVGYAPFDSLETTVLAVATALNSPETRLAHPSIGEDIKVMGVRAGTEMQPTVACALVGRHVTDLNDCIDKKDTIRALALEAARTATDMPLRVAVNAGDRDSPDCIYLTVTGLSAEALRFATAALAAASAVDQPRDRRSAGPRARDGPD